MRSKLINIVILHTLAFSSGGYDISSAHGKGAFHFSLTLNPFNYFKQGQSYLVIGYGLTKKINLKGYYSNSSLNQGNYYMGLTYQYYNSTKLNLSSAIGLRKYTNSTITHIFFPQLLYSINLNEKLKLCGSVVNIRNQNLKSNLGTAIDTFILYNIFDNKKYKIDFTIGGFKPALWKPKDNNFYPTYSFDITIK